MYLLPILNEVLDSRALRAFGFIFKITQEKILYITYMKARKKEKKFYFFGLSAFDEKWICLLADVENIILGKTNRELT